MKNGRVFNLGYTLTELTIVIVVIGILAAITLVSYNGITARAKTAKAVDDLNNLVEIINNAKARTGKALWQITHEYAVSQGNSTYSETWNERRCTVSWRTSNSLSTDLRNIPISDPCAADMQLTWAAISQAAHASISENPPRDAWGSPYLLDSNEDEATGDNVVDGTSYPKCSIDSVTYPALPGTNDDTIKSVGANGVYVWANQIRPTKQIDRVVCLNGS